MVKLGLGDTYNKTIINRKVRAYADITKPTSSIGIMATIPFATILFGELFHTGGLAFLLDHIEKVIYASTTAFLLHGGSQALNMSEDAHIDQQSEHKQNRPIPSGVISKEEARALAWIFISLGLARAFMITTSFGIFALALAFNGIFYNLEPIRSKEILWVNVSWQAISRGFLLYPATFAVWGKPLNPIAWSLGVIAFLLVLAMQQTADLPDIEMDREAGITTPAVYHSPRPLVKIMAGIIASMFIILSTFIYFGVIPKFYSLYLLVVPIGASLVYLYRNPGGVSDVSGQSPTWFVYYGCLAGLYMLPAIQLVVF